MKKLKLKKDNGSYQDTNWIKDLSNIQIEMRKHNKHWWEEERKDLDLKYYVPLDNLLNKWKDYEVGMSQRVQRYIDKKNQGHYFTVYSIANYYDELVRKGKAKYLGGDNTYNHCGKVQSDFNWSTYKVNDKYIVLVMIHIGGDIRGNYTKYFVLQFDYDTEFLEVIDEVSREGNLTFSIEVNEIVYDITPLALDECLEVYDFENDDYIYGIWSCNDEDTTEQIIEKIKEKGDDE